MNMALDKCKHAVEGARATQQLHQALRKSQIIEKLLVAVVALTIVGFSSGVALAGQQHEDRIQPYAIELSSNLPD